MNNTQILIGEKFNLLTILSIGEKIKSNTTVNCQCDCGNIAHNVYLRNVLNGHTKSCGCLKNKWPREKIIREYMKLYEEHPNITLNKMVELNMGGLSQAIVKVFGGITNLRTSLNQSNDHSSLVYSLQPVHWVSLFELMSFLFPFCDSQK